MAIQLSSELLDGAVLGLLSEQDYYGYALTKKVQESFPVSESTMYPVLRRLKKNAALETYDEAYEGRNRRYYRITMTGETMLTKLQEEWELFRENVDTILKLKESGEEDERNDIL
ncbi:MAG: PadR family transcriptional regulator [Lactobacillales bacterium]|nr:PadR family transcriptional regulator [Lactobacillales bacterium]